MLSLSRRLARLVLGTFVIALMATALTVVVASPASAGPCDGDSDVGQIEFGDCDPGSDGEDGDDSSGSGTPSCTIKPGDNACYKGESCLVNDPSTLTIDEVPEGSLPPKPGDDYHHAFRICPTTGYVWYWSKEDEPSPAELATEAFNKLKTPAFTPTFNPPTRTLVNLPTWWWAAGPAEAPISESAGSVTVTATPDRIEVDPGDGTGVLTCEFVTQMSDACSHVYVRSSKGDGYPGRVRLMYDIGVTDGGATIGVPGIPAELGSPWVGVTVPVREVQTLNRPNR